ncbi:MAG: hypoxanthine phosphoribosyltransferase [Porcipelethomonas sp.]
MTKQEFNKSLKRVLISESEIRARIRETGERISREYEDKPLLLVSILNGAFVFMADLCRAVSIPCEIAFMCASSYYSGTSSSGTVDITMDIKQDISGFHVIIVEDIIDTGRTLNDIIKLLKSRNPLSLKIVTLLDKPERRIIDLKADISLFTIPDVFVVGYGLDYNGIYRNLPYIAEYEGEECL